MLSIIEQRLKKYEINTETQQENALKEITQEIILGALAKVNFFEVGIFHGGTSLRILYGLERFSEDLDFLLKQPDPSFKWQPYSDAIKKKCIFWIFYSFFPSHYKRFLAQQITNEYP